MASFTVTYKQDTRKLTKREQKAEDKKILKGLEKGRNAEKLLEVIF